jgi:hypothetical protein
MADCSLKSSYRFILFYQERRNDGNKGMNPLSIRRGNNDIKCCLLDIRLRGSNVLDLVALV